MYALAAGVAVWTQIWHEPTEAIVEQVVVLISDGGQVIHLPKSMVFYDEVKCVDVVIVGRTRIITPAGESWDSWFDDESVSADFMCERN